LFFQEETELLQYIVYSNDIKLVSKPLNKVCKFKLLEIQTELKSFTYLYRFYKKHIYFFTAIASFLTNLPRIDKKFILSLKITTVTDT